MLSAVFLLCVGSVLVEANPKPFLVENYKVSASGCITCDGEAMPFVKVLLMDEDPVVDETMGTTQANGAGCFSVSGYGRDLISGTPEPFIRVEYQYSGPYGTLEIEQILGINRYGATPPRNYVATINYGTINFSSIHCKAYVLFYKALVDYASRAGVALPYSSLHVITDSILTAGTPYSTTDTIRIPSSYTKDTLSYYVAKHEFAHTVRHSFDGSLAHFLVDVVSYSYAQYHKCETITNLGFAFNEGWADYWAGLCYDNYGSANDYRIEGNVAKGLRALEVKCGASKFVKLLSANPGSIHSFDGFNAKHGSTYGCKL